MFPTKIIFVMHSMRPTFILICIVHWKNHFFALQILFEYALIHVMLRLCIEHGLVRI